MESPKKNSRKLFLRYGMRTRTLYDVIMQCTAKHCGHEESVLDDDQLNFDTPLFLHCIGLEHTVDCLYACDGVKESKHFNYFKIILTNFTFSAKRSQENK